LASDHALRAEIDATDPGYASKWALPKFGWDQVHGVLSPAGTTIFICKRPTKPGARPAKAMCADSDPMVALAADVTIAGFLGDATPSATAGLTGPDPVR
jgi:hypothetical protein